MERFAISFIFTCYMLFLQANGLNLFEANLVNAAYFIALFLCEIPTGAIADVFGRKRSYVLSCLIHGLSLFVYSQSTTLYGFMIAEIIGAVGFTCASGAFQAWLVDSLKHYGGGNQYMPIFARAEQLAALVGIIGAFVGSYLFGIDINLPWLIGGVIFTFTGIFAYFSMREDYFERSEKTIAEYWREFINTIARSAKHARSNANFRFLIFASLFQFCAIQAPNMHWQLLFSGLTGDKKWLPYVYTAIAISMIIGYSIARSASKRIINERTAISTVQIIIGLGIALSGMMNLLPWAISVFLIHEVARGMYKPLRDAYLNDNIPSAERATLISFEAMSQHIGGVIGLVVSGIVAECVSIPFAWLLSGTSLIIAALLMIRNGK
ncbi:MAG: MFS transporter [Candidatus Magasanikbacteria bacterium]|nr:MFS transporter [Candidatus Magasanikbacteria bacterium]